MEVTPVDPRDVAWEVDRPTYRVYFWTDDSSARDERVTGAANIHGMLG